MSTEVRVPDIGDFTDVPIIEVHVSPGDKVNAEDPLLTLESDKATLDVPAPTAGTVGEVLVKVGDEVSEGMPILMLSDGDGASTTPPSLVEQQEAPPGPEQAKPVAAAVGAPLAAPPSTAATETGATGTEAGDGSAPAGAHAGPSVRRMARELGVDLAAVTASGPKGRITKDDLLGFLKGPSPQPAAAAPAAPQGSGIPEIPAQDFSKFGPVETQKLPRIKKVSGPFLHRSWLNVPHVTHNDEADITELDAYRKRLDTAAKADKNPYRVTLLAFLVKAVVAALKEHPEFNSSLTAEKDAIVLKSYYNIGIAVDTPGGLVVPTVKDADRKGIVELSREFMAISAKARDGKLSGDDMAGGTFTISSLGGIGGTSFTPIVNAPEVAILGVVRSAMKPVWNGTEFAPRLMLPLSVSYDHRVIDGALAARFTRHLCYLLEDDRRLLL
jgi:pyruvate dehydrogenase E2 component (dihydrolipoamide acetyltransferase)